jgi:hypothetical protein
MTTTKQHGKKIEITNKGAVVYPPQGEYDQIAAFQMVEITINFFGKIMTAWHDTKILHDGRQVVINGDGFIPAGYEIA